MYPQRKIYPYQYGFPQFSPAMRQSMGVPRGESVTQPGPQQQQATGQDQLNQIGGKVGEVALRKALEKPAANITWNGPRVTPIEWNGPRSTGTMLGDDYGLMGDPEGSTVQFADYSAPGTMLGDDYGLLGSSEASNGVMLGDDYGLLAGSGGEGAASTSAAAEGGGAAGGGAGFGAYATPLGYAALIGSGKMIEHENPNSTVGRGLLSMLGPSINQVAADPKLGVTTALGVPFLNGFIRNDSAANATPEWAGLFNLFG